MTRLNASKMTYKEALEIIKKLPMHEYLLSVGSVASEQPFPQDLDFLTTVDLNKFYKLFLEKYPKTWHKLNLGEQRFDYYPIIDGKRIVINIWKTDLKHAPFFYFQYGYPRGFVIAMRKKAKEMGYKLNQYGIYKNDVKQKVNTINEIFKFFKIKYRTPKEQYLKHLKKIQK